MSYGPIAADLAVRLTRQQLDSARLDAPVVPERPARPARQRLRGLRATTASGLHRVATWLEPADPCRVAPTRG